MDLNWLRLYDELSRIDGYLNTIVHPNLVLARILDDSIGLLLKVWFNFVLTTTDIEKGGDFVAGSAILRFEPKIQIAADAALVLIAADRKSTRLNSSHDQISYAVFCLKKQNTCRSSAGTGSGS